MDADGDGMLCEACNTLNSHLQTNAVESTADSSVKTLSAALERKRH